MAKKRILIVNKFLYPRGGDCIVALSEAELLRSDGYEVAFWAMDYPDNQPSPTSQYYAPRIDFSNGVKGKLRAAKRIMGMGDVKKSFKTMLDRFRPDTVHFHNIHSYLSPVIVEMAKKAGARTLWTMHDYKLACPSYLCIGPDGKPCTACISHPWSVVERRCMKGSLGASLLARAEAIRWNVNRLVTATDMFICPSSFMSSILSTAGVPRSKTCVICNFIDPAKYAILSRIPHDLVRNDRLILYVGRLSKEKGADTLVKDFAAMADMSLTLRIYGDGPLKSELEAAYGNRPDIEFRGHADAAQVAMEMASARLLICPSQCYDNNPLSVIEALSAGTPVLGSDIGGIPELITPTNGMLYEPTDPDALTGALRGMLVRSFDNETIKAEAMSRFSAETHLNLLEKLL